MFNVFHDREEEEKNDHDKYRSTNEKNKKRTNIITTIKIKL